MILGLLQPNAGSLTLFGEPLNGTAKHLNQRIGAALEIPAFYPYLSGRDNLRVFAKALGGVSSPSKWVSEFVCSKTGVEAQSYWAGNYSACHCEERSDEAISTVAYMLKVGDCFATPAMTSNKVIP
jgi:ABC-type multidrug transport system ATPase subunit